MRVAPYISFKCPITKRFVVDQVLFTNLTPSYELDCWTMVGGCGGKHRNDEVEIVAIDHYLGITKGSEFYTEEQVKDFELFLDYYNYQNLPERPNENGVS